VAPRSTGGGAAHPLDDLVELALLVELLLVVDVGAGLRLSPLLGEVGRRGAVLGVLRVAHVRLLARLLRGEQDRLDDLAVVLRLRRAPARDVQRRPLPRRVALRRKVGALLEERLDLDQVAGAHLVAEEHRLVALGHVVRHRRGRWRGGERAL